jgi:hypothetical protein
VSRITRHILTRVLAGLSAAIMAQAVTSPRVTPRLSQLAWPLRTVEIEGDDALQRKGASREQMASVVPSRKWLRLPEGSSPRSGGPRPQAIP